MITEILNEQKEYFVERDDVLHGMMVALLSGHHVLLLGPPGTAKSMIARDFCNRIDGAKYFERLLTRFSVPEELFGPISLEGLKNDRFSRITEGYLPSAHIAFVDEIFKANSSILNSLLTLINERIFHNDGNTQQVPLKLMIGASNELPESEELGALYDRFLLRYVVDYVKEDSGFIEMLQKSANGFSATISLEDLEEVQAEVQRIMIPDSIYTALLTIRKALNQDGVIASDRRYKQSIDAIKASAFLSGRQMASEDDLLVLQDILWSQPAEQSVAKKAVFDISNPLLYEANELLDEAQEVRHNALKETDPKERSNLGVEANVKCRKIKGQLEKLAEKAQEQGRDDDAIRQNIDKVTEWNKEVIRECLGINA